MKHRYLLSLIIVLLAFSSCTQDKKTEATSEIVTSTYYFIRHAEKDRSDPSDKNPHLTEIGKARAQHWSIILDKVKFDEVYSTQYNRTKETAQPTAFKNNLELKSYDPNQIEAQSFMNETKGKTVLIVGHSNTTPAFVNKLLGHKKYEDIDDSNNGNLYIVTVCGDNISDQMLVIN
ncbi:SixA phosphatase family protein [Flavobacteriaceae bacterium LMO-SS05]